MEGKLEMTREIDAAMAREGGEMDVDYKGKGMRDHSFSGNLRELWEDDCCLMLTLKWQEYLLWKEDGSSS